MHNNQQVSFLHTAARLADVLETLDTVHTAASGSTLETLNGRGKAELIALLREIAYVAAETAHELEHDQPQPRFRVIEGGAKGTAAPQDQADGPDSAAHHLFRVLVADADTSLPSYVSKQVGGKW